MRWWRPPSASRSPSATPRPSSGGGAWLSRPTWRILLYSAENPPTRRGLVLVDGVDGEIVASFTEDNPEDWSDLDGKLATS